jgi:hypothetical protein
VNARKSDFRSAPIRFPPLDKSTKKRFLVLAAARYGVGGALIALYLIVCSFGFMAFLGIASLIGVIVSHLIVLFDFIEEMREKANGWNLALLDAGIVRLHPAMITLRATILALFRWPRTGIAVAAVLLRADRRTRGGDLCWCSIPFSCWT